MKRSLGFQLAMSSVLPFLLFFSAPLCFYFDNFITVKFSLTSVLLPVAAMFAGISCLFFLLFYSIRNNPRFFKVLSGLIIGFSVAIWAQIQLLGWGFKVVEGKVIEISQWRIPMIIELIIWGLIITSFVFFIFRGGESRTKMTLQVIFLLGFISITTSFLSAPSKAAQIDNQKDFDEVFSFHEKNNVIIVLLQGFQSDYFDLIRKEHPDEVSFLDGFTFFKNTMSHYPTSTLNLPAIESGKLFKNQEQFINFSSDAFSGFNLEKYYREKGYNSTLVSRFPGNVSLNELLQHSSAAFVAPLNQFLDYGIFKSVPTVLKKYIYNNGTWLLSSLSKLYPPVPFGDDVRFVELFEKSAEVKSSARVGSFKFIQLYSPQLPMCVDEKMQYNDSLSGKEGYLKQARGALTLVKRMVQRMKELNLYENSEIVVMADNGTLEIPLLGRESGLVPNRIISSSLPLFLYKAPMAKGVLKVDNAPLYNSDVGCLLKVKNANLDYTGFNSARNGENRPRTFIFYDGNAGYDNIPKMTEYIVAGPAYESENWRLGNRLYTPTGIVDVTSDCQYVIGTTIDFSSKGKASNYLLAGWSDPEPSHRWTDSRLAGLHFQIATLFKGDLVLRLKGYGYSVEGKIDNQKVNVLINGHQVAQWMVKNDMWYEATIPNSIVPDGQINMVFEISNPAAPADFGQSDDKRMLGMAVRELEIKEKKPEKMN